MVKFCFSVLLILFISINFSYGNEKNTKEGFISVKGGKVWYKITGADKKGIPLLVLHGGPGFPHDYLTSLEELSDERPVVFYDQLGCGNSEKPKDTSLWTIIRFVEELETVRKELKLGKVHILGQGWGNMLLVDYMLTKKPKGVISLIFASPCLSSSRFIKDQKVYLSQMPKETQKIIKDCEDAKKFNDEKYLKAMMDYYKLHVCRMDPWPECINKSFEKLGTEVYVYMWGPSEFTVTGTLKNYERADRLKEIKVPTLFTTGEFDEVTPETAKYFQSKMPGSEIKIFKGGSHEHHLEKSKEYNEYLRNFLHKTEK